MPTDELQETASLRLSGAVASNAAVAGFPVVAVVAQFQNLGPPSGCYLFQCTLSTLRATQVRPATHTSSITDTSCTASALGGGG